MTEKFLKKLKALQKRQQPNQYIDISTFGGVTVQPYLVTMRRKSTKLNVPRNIDEIGRWL